MIMGINNAWRIFSILHFVLNMLAMNHLGLNFKFLSMLMNESTVGFHSNIFALFASHLNFSVYHLKYTSLLFLLKFVDISNLRNIYPQFVARVGHKIMLLDHTDQESYSN